MKLKYLLSVIAIVAISKSSFAQYAKDAIRFSTFQTGSTSRIKGVGNAGIAIGGDLSSIGGNPAGLGFFTKSEASLTPEFDQTTVNANYLGLGAGSTIKNSPNISNASIVFYSRLNSPRGMDKTKGWVSANFGIGFNRTNDYGENISFGGRNNSNSITDYYAGLANNDGVADGTLPGWAYNHNLIDLYGKTNPVYKSNANAGVQQLNNINRTGGQSEVNLSAGGNYSNRLYLGVSLGISTLRFNSTNDFVESGTASILENSVPTLRNFSSTYSQFQQTTGSGFNGKIGMIYKITESVRFGALITTPTYYSIDDSYSEELNTSISNGNKYSDGPENYPLTYTMHTPFKASGGLSFFSKYGFITGDVEYVDYSTTHISTSDNFNSSFDNSTISRTYRATVNAHVGAELKPIPALALRGGYSTQGSPLKTGGSSTNTTSGGLGYRVGNYYVDAAYLHSSGSQMLLPYDIGTASPAANLSKSSNSFFVTFGFRY